MTIDIGRVGFVGRIFTVLLLVSPGQAQSLSVGGSVFVGGVNGQVKEIPVGTKVKINVRSIDGGPRELPRPGPDADELILGSLRAARSGEFDDSGRLFDKALGLMERHRGADHPDILTAFDRQARIYRSIDQVGLAGGLLQRVQDRWMTGLGTNHPKLPSLISDFADWLFAEGRTPEALDSMGYVIEIQSSREQSIEQPMKTLEDRLAGLAVGSVTQSVLDSVDQVAVVLTKLGLNSRGEGLLQILIELGPPPEIVAELNVRQTRLRALRERNR